MNHLAKAGIATLSAGAIGGASYAVHHFSKDSFESKLGVSVLNLTGNQNESIWTNRFKEFSQDTTTLLAPNLKKADIQKWQDLQNWCNNNRSNTFDKDNQGFKNFESFCTWKIGDKLTTGYITKETQSDNQKWKAAYDNLKSKGKGKTLSAGLSEVFSTVAGSKKEDQVAMHKWCTESYKATWKGDNDQSFEEAKEYCKG